MADIAAGKTFQFELVSPEKVLVSEQVALVEIPGETGNFGVLADHAPLLSSIRPGIVTVTGADGVVKKIFVAGGFADVSNNTCALLAEEAANLADLDVQKIEASLKSLDEDLQVSKDDAVKTALIQKKIAAEQAKIEALKQAA